MFTSMVRSFISAQSESKFSLRKLAVSALLVSISFLASIASAEDSFLFHNFGRVQTNSRMSVVYGLTNTGDAPLEIKSITYSGAYFSASSRCPDVLEAGTKCDTMISFWPMMDGLWVGRVVWETSDGNIFLDLQGQGFHF